MIYDEHGLEWTGEVWVSQRVHLVQVAAIRKNWMAPSARPLNSVHGISREIHLGTRHPDTI